MKPTRRGFLGTLIAGAILPKLKPAQSPSEPLKPVPIQDLSSSLSISHSIVDGPESDEELAKWMCLQCGSALDNDGMCTTCNPEIEGNWDA